MRIRTYRLIQFTLAGVLCLPAGLGRAQEATITIRADKALHSLSPYLTGACLEDVNHEIYGGLYSQMIFGESFQEPPPLPLKEFSMFGGRWTPLHDGGVQVTGGEGAKIVWDGPGLSQGEASVDVRLTESNGGNGGLILKVSDAASGPDSFNGYELSIERPGTLVIGRHRQNWEPIRRIPCDVPLDKWITLTAHMTATTLEALIDGKSVAKYEDTEHPLTTGKVGLRSWQRDVRFRNFSVTAGGVQHEIPFEVAHKGAWSNGVSGMWAPLSVGTATGEFSTETANPFVGTQSQVITFSGGTGAIGIGNQGLNRRGMSFVSGNPYTGTLDVRADAPTTIWVALENADGSAVYTEQSLSVTSNNWQQLNFNLTPTAGDGNGRFAIKLKQPGSVVVGYAFLQPGPWGCFQGLPVRKDVAEALINQGVTVLRYGGSMVNAPEYRWKKMIGPRDRRPPYTGTWYPYSTDGWGILDFLNLCEAAGFLGVPDFNINETPQDMADFMQYVNGSTNTIWGAQRMADGHPQPYGLNYIELGNEESVNGDYYQKFQALAKAIWAVDTNVILVVGDFSYHQVITNPFSFGGADSRITTLAAQQQILSLARQNNREVWFDLHVWTDGPASDASLAAMFSYDSALGQIADGARYKVVVFELNANNHSQRRALANALAINAIERDGRLPITTSANCLQPDGQNDNGWDQGLLFLNQSNVWLQPPGYVTRMISHHDKLLLVETDVQSSGNLLQASAKRSEDGKSLVLNVVNLSEKVAPTSIILRGFSPARPMADLEELSASLSAKNSAEMTDQIHTIRRDWRPAFKNGETEYDFRPYSFTVIRIK